MYSTSYRIGVAILVGDSPHSMTITEVLDSLSLSTGGEDKGCAFMPESPGSVTPSVIYCTFYTDNH